MTAVITEAKLVTSLHLSCEQAAVPGQLHVHGGTKQIEPDAGAGLCVGLRVPALLEDSPVNGSISGARLLIPSVQRGCLECHPFCSESLGGPKLWTAQNPGWARNPSTCSQA